MGETKRLTVKREPRPREEKLLPGLSTLSGTSQSSVPSLAPRAVRTSRPEGYPGSLNTLPFADRNTDLIQPMIFHRSLSVLMISPKCPRCDCDRPVTLGRLLGPGSQNCKGHPLLAGRPFVSLLMPLMRRQLQARFDNV